MRLGSVCVVGMVTAVLAGQASAQETTVSAADRAYAEGRFDEAVAGYEGALRRGLDRDALHRAHLQLGVLRAIMGERDAARRHFALALAMRPDTPAPAELDPGLRAELEELRRTTQALVPQLELDGAARNDVPTTLRVRLEHRLASEVASYHVSAEPPGAPAWTVTVEVSAPEVLMPAAAWRASSALRVTVDALDAHGGVLARSAALELRHELVEPAVEPSQVPGPELVALPSDSVPRAPPLGSSVFDEGWFWGLIVGVAASAALAIGLGVGLSEGGYILRSIRFPQ
jgi:tetratricopeptide (TPR) repeat protein